MNRTNFIQGFFATVEVHTNKVSLDEFYTKKSYKKSKYFHKLNLSYFLNKFDFIGVFKKSLYKKIIFYE